MINKTSNNSNNTNANAKHNKILNIELWTVDNVCEWLKGIGEKAEKYIENFRSKQINGKKLMILESSDLTDIGVKIIDHRIVIYNSIRNLIRIKHDLTNETLHSQILSNINRATCIISYIHKHLMCKCHTKQPAIICESCYKLQHDIVRLASCLTVSMRRLLTWLTRAPFTQVKELVNYCDEINNQMKLLFKAFRKYSYSYSAIHDFYITINENLRLIIDTSRSILDVCDNVKDDGISTNQKSDQNQEKQQQDQSSPSINGNNSTNKTQNSKEKQVKPTIINNYCYLEKVIIRKNNVDQQLGLTFNNFIDGIYTVVDIEKESSSDECSRLNIGDDIFAINDQVIIGWNASNVYNLLANLHSTNSTFVLLLRKMPREYFFTLKQQQFYQSVFSNNKPNYNKNQNVDSVNNTMPRDNKKHLNKHTRNSSIIMLSDFDTLENSSDDEDELPIFGNTRHSNSADNRRIQSMHNLHMQNSRSSSADMLDNISTTNYNLPIENQIQKDQQKKKGRLKSEDIESTKSEFSRSDIFKGLFSSKKSHEKSDIFNRKKNSYSLLANTEPSTPYLLTIRKLDQNNNNNQSITDLNNCNNNNTNEAKPPLVLKKPPLAHKVHKTSSSSQSPSLPQKLSKPIYQGWLCKYSQPISSGSIGNKSPNIIKNLNLKKQRFWSVLMKEYIAFYKQQDDSKGPKEYILLKNCEIKVKSERKLSFKIIDYSKNCENDMYADSYDEFIKWLQILNELRAKLEPYTPQSPLGNSSMINDDSQHNYSSRESSPASSKIQSRDSSPSLFFHSSSFNKNGATSESEYETDTNASTQQSSPSLANSSKNSSHSLEKKTKSKFSLHDLNSDTKSSNHKKPKTLNKMDQNMCLASSYGIYNIDSYNEQQRCNSLPGSLQTCVGSYLNDHYTKPPHPPTQSQTPTPYTGVISASNNTPTTNSTTTTSPTSTTTSNNNPINTSYQNTSTSSTLISIPIGATSSVTQIYSNELTSTSSQPPTAPTIPASYTTAAAKTTYTRPPINTNTYFHRQVPLASTLRPVLPPSATSTITLKKPSMPPLQSITVGPQQTQAFVVESTPTMYRTQITIVPSNYTSSNNNKQNKN